MSAYNDMLNQIGLIVGIIAGVVSIVIALRSIRWKIFFFKFRLKRILNDYIKKYNNKQKERDYVLKLGKLIDKVLKRLHLLEKLGFQPFGNRGIGNDKFRLYFKKGFKFTIKDLKNSQAYFSKNFEEATLNKSVDRALYNFLEYLKE